MTSSERRGAVRTVVKDVGWNLPVLVLVKAKGVVLVVVLSRLLGVEGLGVWAQANVLASLVLVVAGFGLYQALVQFYPETDERGRAGLLWTALAATACGSLALGFGVWAFAGSLAAVFTGTSAHAAAFAVSGAVGAVWALRFVLLHHLRARHELERYSLALGAAELVDLVGAIVAATLTRTVSGALMGSFVAALLTTAVLARAAGRPRVERAALSKMARYGLPIAWTQLADAALARGDRLLVGAVLGPAAAGLYAAVVALVSAPNVLGNSLVSVLFPRLAGRTWSKSGGRHVQHLAVLAYGGSSIAFLALIVWLRAPVLGLLLDTSVDAATPLAWIMLTTGVGVAAFGSGRILSLELFTDRRTLTLAAVWTAAAALNLGLNAVLLPRHGLLGAGVATLVANVGFIVVCSILVRQRAGGAAVVASPGASA